jgi:hypothetical protein
VDDARWLKLLTRVPDLVPFHPILEIDELKVGEKERFINNGILKCIEFWKLGCQRMICMLKL